MKSIIRKIGLALVLLSIFKIGVAIEVDFYVVNACAGDKTHFVSTITGSSSITSVRWYFGSDTTTISDEVEFTYTFTNPDNYLVTLEAYIDTVLVGSQSKVVPIYDLPIAAFYFMDDCVGSRAQFTFIPDNDGNPDNDVEVYQWDYGDGEGELNNIENPTHIYTDDGSFDVTLIVTSIHGCKDTLSSMIDIYPPPDIEIKGTLEEICEGEMIELYVEDYPEVYWGASVPLTDEQVYNDTLIFLCPEGLSEVEAEVVAFEVFGGSTVCKDTGYVFINVHPIPEINVTSTETLVLPGGETELGVTSNTTIVEYFWNPIQNMDNPYTETPTVIVIEPTTFYVSITDENGCKNSGSIFIDVDLKADNLITPNGDGRNDTWFAANGGLSDSFELIIYNRWGEEVLNQKGYENDWDGTSNGDKLPEGAYFYVIKHEDVTYTGSITLLR